MAQLTKEQSRQLLELLKENPKMRSKEAFERLGVTPTQLASFKYIHSKEIHGRTEEDIKADAVVKAAVDEPAKSTAQIGRELGMDADEVEKIKRERQMEISDRIDGITPGMRAAMDARAEAGIATTEARMAARASAKAEDAERNEMLLAIGYNVYRNSPSILTEVESLRKMMRLVFIKLGEMSLDNMLKNMQEEWTKKDTE